MSADLPSIRFPRPELALPPSPESTLEPLPPSDDPRLARAPDDMDPLTWYLYSALQNSGSYPDEDFSLGYSDMHMGDIVVPVFERAKSYEEDRDADQVIGWKMWCLMCPSGLDQGEPDRNTTTGYPFCNERMLSTEPVESYSTLEAPDLEVPIATDSGADSIMACAINLNLYPGWVQRQSIQVDQYKITSQPFIVNRDLRGPESEYPGIRYRYNTSFPRGVPDDQAPVPQSSLPTPTPTTTSDPYGWWDAPTSSYTWPTNKSWKADDDDNDNNESARTGIIIGIIVPLALLGAVITFFCKTKRRPQPAPPPPIPRDRNPTADAMRQTAFSQQTYLARRNRAAAAAPPSSAPRVDPEETPPAYHKVVSNRERMEVERRMQADGTAPPAYREDQSAASTLISRPAPVARVARRSGDGDPALPPTPPG